MKYNHPLVSGIVALILAALLMPACAMAQTQASPNGSATLTPMANISALMPKHGTVITSPAVRWEDALAAGNGIQGALLYGDPRQDTLIVDHSRCWLPLGSVEIVPNTGPALMKLRQVIASQGYHAGQQEFITQGKAAGWSGNLTWTDPFHPGFILDIDQPGSGPMSDYARVENFETGEVWAQWRTSKGAYSRRMFVSRLDNIIVVTTTGPRGAVDLTVDMQPIGNTNIDATIVTAVNQITCHNVYIHGKGGYDGVVRVITQRGSTTTDGKVVTVSGADSVTMIIRIQPWKTPVAGNDDWQYSPKNPDFFRSDQTAGVYRAAVSYNPTWMKELTASVDNVSPNYETLSTTASAAWKSIFDRTAIDLNADPADRGLSSEALISNAKAKQELTPALAERMYDAGRYVFMCSAGPYSPPNLFGIWTGTWQPAWSGDYTIDTNLELDVQSAYSANMADLMGGFFRQWDAYVPDFQTNAEKLYGCRGILAGIRASNNGLDLHYNDHFVGNQWTPGAAWIAHFYYDYYLFTGDKKFLRNEAVPYMEQCALFYQDFLAGSVDSNGRYLFTPSFSAENGSGDDSSQDIEISNELISNLIDAYQTLGIKPARVVELKAMLAKMPPLLINDSGQLKEWSNPSQGEKNNHRHLMHLYGAFQSRQFSPDNDLSLYNAALVALHNRLQASTEDATHGFMQRAMAADELGLGEYAFDQLSQLAKHGSIFENMVDGHYGGPRILCDDGNGATPDILDQMAVQSDVGRILLLPAMPSELPRGTLTGTRARGAILINRVSWDIPAGELSAKITSDISQTITLVLPPNALVQQLTVDGKVRQSTTVGLKKLGCLLSLQGGRTVSITAKLHFVETSTPLPA